MAGSFLGKALLFSLVTIQLSSAANILIFSFPQLSHIAGAANVGQVLQEQGHNVTIAIPPKMETMLADRELDVLLYHSLGDYYSMLEDVLEVAIKSYFQGTISRALLENMVFKFSEKILTDKQLFQDIRAFRPDLLILSSGVPARMLSTMVCKVDVPFVFIGETIQNQFARAPLLPSVVPSKWFDATDQMTFWQRLSNTFIEYMFYFYVPFVSENTMSRYCPGRPGLTIHELQAEAQLWIDVHDGILGYNKPIMPNIVQVSNLLPQKRKTIPAEFQSFMNNAKDGVVIVSFGSVIKSFPREAIDKMLTAFKQTNYHFVIRYSTQNLSGSEKMLFTKWMPQLELLSHKNTRLFITHCGASGQQEAIYAGVPMLGLPLLNDQPHNSARIVRKGFGLRLDIRTFTVDDLVSAIEEIITNPEYKTRTKKASAIIQSARVPPVEEAAYWINHVLTFGGEHLRSVGQDIPLWKYLGLDVIFGLGFCFLVLNIFLFILIKTIFFLFHCCCGKEDKVKGQ